MSQEKILSLKNVNILRGDREIYNLPVVDEENKRLQDGAEIKLLFSYGGLYDVKCLYFPIRYRKTYGNRVQINKYVALMNIHNTASFIFDAVKEVWELVYLGYVCFHEQEVYGVGGENA
jgi:hypothetical protein